MRWDHRMHRPHNQANAQFLHDFGVAPQAAKVFVMINGAH
jgi:hypothetical protein